MTALQVGDVGRVGRYACIEGAAIAGNISVRIGCQHLQRSGLSRSARRTCDTGEGVRVALGAEDLLIGPRRRGALAESCRVGMCRTGALTESGCPDRGSL